MIDKKKYYTLNEIHKYKLIPFVGIRRLRKLINNDEIKAESWGEGKGKRYKIKGKFIKDYLKKLNI